MAAGELVTSSLAGFFGLRGASRPGTGNLRGKRIDGLGGDFHRGVGRLA